MIGRKRRAGKLSRLSVPLWIAGAACATPTIGDRVSVQRVEGVAASAGGEVSEATLVGGGGRDLVAHVDCASDGSLTIFGETHKSFGESTDILAVRLSASGQVDWARTLGGRDREEVIRVLRTADGGYVVVATSRSLFYTPMPGEVPARPLVVKLSAAAVPQWSVVVEEKDHRVIAWLADVVQTADGGYLLAGGGLSGPRYDVREPAVVRLDPSGQPVWSRRYSFGSPGVADAVAALPDGDVVVAGTVERPAGSGAMMVDVAVLRLSPDGTPRWARKVSTEGRSLVSRHVVRADDGLVVAGEIAGGGAADIMAMRFSAAGALAWSRRYRDEKTRDATPLTMARAAPGDLVIAGRSGAKRETPGVRGLAGVVLVLGEDGVPKLSSTFGGDRDEEIRSVQALDDGRLCLALNTEGFGATFSDVLTAVWTPPNPPAAEVALFDSEPLEVRSSELDVQSEPLPYRHESLPVRLLNERTLEKPAPAR